MLELRAGPEAWEKGNMGGMTLVPDVIQLRCRADQPPRLHQRLVAKLLG